MKKKLTSSIGLAAMAVAGLLLAHHSVRAADDDYERPYHVVDGKVDQSVYNGYRRYSSSCHVCHGPDGLGSSYAPNLTDSLKTMSRDDFNEVVINGRKNFLNGQDKVMPAFGEVADVAMYIDDIYAYLKARSDGVIGRGRPERMAPQQAQQSQTTQPQQ